MLLDVALIYNGIYGLLLGILILSWHFSEFFIRLFVKDNYSLGNFGQTWANWHAIGCFYVGLSSLLALTWGASLLEAKLQICLLTTVVYGIWFVQNFYLVFFTNKMKTFMLLHVVGCFVGAVLGLMGGINSLL